MIEIRDLSHTYLRYGRSETDVARVKALCGVNLDIREGEFLAVIGTNGSGKSTLAKHLNGLLVPESGSVLVDGIDTKEERADLMVQKTAAMVFQNPDNQIIGATVEEDIAFGLENMQVPAEEMPGRIDDSLRAIHMEEKKHASCTELSGGQKQKTAIAGAVAVSPRYLILDEATAMLDPQARAEVLRIALELRKERGMAIVLITHYMEEIIRADRIVVMKEGQILRTGTPEEIFAETDWLSACGLEAPAVTRFAADLSKGGVPLHLPVLMEEDLCGQLLGLWQERRQEESGEIGSGEIGSERIEPKETGSEKAKPEENKPEKNKLGPVEPEHVLKKPDQSVGHGRYCLEARHLSYTYPVSGDQRIEALSDVSLGIEQGSFTALVGQSGSGKSTFAKHLNGLLQADRGELLLHGGTVYGKGGSLKKLREKVGLVFQYPEHQLFSRTVLQDAAFGPQNLGCTEEEALERAREALSRVGLSEDLYQASPFELSGGQMRRAAIAGVLAMQPEVLVLDEPTAGLDPVSKRALFQLLKEMQKEGVTIIIISHSMEDVADYADRVVVFQKGRVIADGTPDAVLTEETVMREAGLLMPPQAQVLQRLQKAGLLVDGRCCRMDRAVSIICSIPEICGKEGGTYAAEHHHRTVL